MTWKELVLWLFLCTNIQQWLVVYNTLKFLSLKMPAAKFIWMQKFSSRLQAIDKEIYP